MSASGKAANAAARPAAAAIVVASPCVSLCQMHADTGWCRGCLRTLGEIAGWSQLDNPGKHAVLQQLQARRSIWRALPPERRDPSAPVR
jgi:predicted Fe-S protein YdhL (DUF1289 family)